MWILIQRGICAENHPQHSKCFTLGELKWGHKQEIGCFFPHYNWILYVLITHIPR